MAGVLKYSIYLWTFCACILFAPTVGLGNRSLETLSGISRKILVNTNTNINVDEIGKQRYDDVYFPVLKGFHMLDSYVLGEFDTNRAYGKKNDMSNETESSLLGVLQDLYENDRITSTTNHSSKCVNDTERLIHSLRKRENWAIAFFDSTGKPGPSITEGRLNFVGNYDQCRAATAVTSKEAADGEQESTLFYGGYFHVTMRSPSTPILIQIGVCLPDSCSEHDIISIGTKLLKAVNVSLTVVSVHHLTNHTEVTLATVIAIIIVSIVVVMMILGTSFDIVFIQFPLWYEHLLNRQTQSLYQQEKPLFDERPTFKDDNFSGKNETTPLLASKTNQFSDRSPYCNQISQILLSFSMYSNGKKILTVSHTPGSIEAIHGIRVLSTCWVIMGHNYTLARQYAINDATGWPKFTDRWTFDAVKNFTLSVDTFFTLSGLLTSYLTIGEVLKKGLKLNWPMFYFHRFWRLTPPYMLSLLFSLGFQQYFIRGPLRNFEQPIDKAYCEDNWWTNLLYVNNLVNVDKPCFDHTWYLANDMQFFVLSPLIMIPFYFHRMTGLCSCLMFLLANWITTGVLSSDKEWSPIMADGDLAWYKDFYKTPWCRIGPFIVGVLAGYVLAIHKGRSLYMKWWVVALGWITSAVSALAVLYGIHDDINGDDPSSVGVAALYNAVSRSVWGACVSWVIIACASGYGGPVNALLSWSPFVVLGRLSYMVYLIHVPIIFLFYQNLDQLFYMNDTTMVVLYLGIVFASNMLAFVFMLGVESPMVGLERALLKRKSR